MLTTLTNAIFPHYCCSCGTIGSVLCEHCKYDIVCDPLERCISCAKPAAASSQVCSSCHEPYAKAWCVGERNEALKLAINLYKYKSVRAAAEPLVDLLDGTIPHLPAHTRVVAVPTIAQHVRVRGYDHAELLAKRFANRRNLIHQSALERLEMSHQQGSSRKERLVQAARAFRCKRVEPLPYLLIDDVCTTGATLHYAAQALRDAGATEVYVAVLAWQPLEKA